MLVTPSHILFALLVAITGASAQATNFSTCGQACLTNIVTNGVCRSVCVTLGRLELRSVADFACLLQHECHLPLHRHHSPKLPGRLPNELFDGRRDGGPAT